MNEQGPQIPIPWILPKIDLERCTACGACVSACTVSALEISGSQPVFSTPENCTYCANCETFCPAGAIACEFEIIWEED